MVRTAWRYVKKYEIETPKVKQYYDMKFGEIDDN